MEIRKPAVSGLFYPSDKRELSKTIDKLLKDTEKISIKDKRILSVIAPHAGYLYSSRIAACSFKQLEDGKFHTAVLLAPSHYIPFEGISVYKEGSFQTPLGLLEINAPLAERLISSHPAILHYPPAHIKEHAIEVELPFLQRLFSKIEIVPIVFGFNNREASHALKETLVEILNDPGVILIVSADFSHYHPYKEAVRLDRKAIELIERLDTEQFIEQSAEKKIEIDAPEAILVMIKTAKAYGAKKSKLIKYTNSGDITGDKDAVVGYAAMMVEI